MVLLEEVAVNMILVMDFFLHRDTHNILWKIIHILQQLGVIYLIHNLQLSYVTMNHISIFTRSIFRIFEYEM